MMWMMSPFDGFTRFHLYLELFLIRCSKPKIFQISPVNYYPILYIRFSWLTFLNISCSLKIFTQYLCVFFSRLFCWLNSLFLLYKSTFSWFFRTMFSQPDRVVPRFFSPKMTPALGNVSGAAMNMGANLKMAGHWGIGGRAMSAMWSLGSWKLLSDVKPMIYN